MMIVLSLKEWFFDLVRPLSVSDDAKAYIIDVMARPERSDLSKESIVIARVNAMNFIDYQRIGDWALWVGSMNHSCEHRVVIETFGRMSYHNCYNLLGRKMSVYEELSQDLPIIVDQIHLQLNELQEKYNYKYVNSQQQERQST